MGWAFCGENSQGREIGYGVEATCDGDCGKIIDRGLGYVCGTMHEENDNGCGFFYACGDCMAKHQESCESVPSLDGAENEDG